ATLPIENGVLPGAGSLAAAVEVCAGVKPLVIGKPEPTMLLTALARIGLASDEVAMVGDRLDTDVTAGKRAGVTTVLVLTGVTSHQDVEKSDLKPDYLFENLAELRVALEKSRKGWVIR
ncbi:MAG: HAD-IA family hydrolase, partial [Chloroflexi bacterium]|nr:HAD-IA family hydrolase [Chloroflexota bacterium]